MKFAGRLALVALLSAWAGMAVAGTIVRGTKTSTGTTAWADGFALPAAELNSDFDTVYNLVNGNIDNANIASSAAIVQSKIVDPELSEIDGYSDSTAEMDDDDDPGSYASRNAAANLQEEIEQLRYRLAQACGTQAAVRANGSGNQDVGWVELCASSHNMVNNYQFSVDSDGDAVPDGYTAVGGGVAIVGGALSGTAEGFGNRIVHVGSSGEGWSYTLDKLKASTRYLISLRATELSGNTNLTTTGAINSSEWRNVDVDFDGATFATYTAVFATDSTPTNVVIKVLCDGGACSGEVTDFGVYELTTDRRVNPRMNGIQVDTDTTHSCTVAGGEDATDASLAVVVPDVGYMVKLTADGGWAAGGSATFTVDIENDTTNVGLASASYTTTSTITRPFSITRVEYPAAGTHTYTVNCTAVTSDVTVTNVVLTAELIPIH